MEAQPISRQTEAQPEMDLVRRAQQGAMEPFEELYRLHESRIYGLCLRMTADPAMAEELTQETFVKVWQKLGSFRGDSKFSTWLHQLAVNVVLSERRSSRRRSRHIVADDRVIEFEPRPIVDQPGTGRDLRQAIAGLPPGARTIFVLHDIEGYRHEEIARLTGRSTGTTKAQLHRARKLLREALNR